MMGLALAAWDLAAMPRQGSFQFLPALLCLLFAFIMQIDANLVNDYFDFRKGTDNEDRLGPERACAQGWVTLKAMRRTIALTTLLACAVGLPLVLYGGWTMVAIGLFCIAGCILYTTHLSYAGWGDALVLLFFGLVPVCTTYYLQTGTVRCDTVCAAVACGVVIDTLLMVNNYRDREGDRLAGKRTLVVRVGAEASEWLYLLLGVAACLLGCVFAIQGRWCAALLPLVYLFLHIRTWKRLCRIRSGRALNTVLGENARNMFLYGLSFTLGIALDGLLRSLTP